MVGILFLYVVFALLAIGATIVAIKLMGMEEG
jgi:hypothetical protein